MSDDDRLIESLDDYFAIFGRPKRYSFTPAGSDKTIWLGEPIDAETAETAETVYGQARRDIAAGEEVKIAFDVVSEVEEGADIGPVLADEPERE